MQEQHKKMFVGDASHLKSSGICFGFARMAWIALEVTKFLLLCKPMAGTSFFRGTDAFNRIFSVEGFWAGEKLQHVRCSTAGTLGPCSRDAAVIRCKQAGLATTVHATLTDCLRTSGRARLTLRQKGLMDVTLQKLFWARAVHAIWVTKRCCWLHLLHPHLILPWVNRALVL